MGLHGIEYYCSGSLVFCIAYFVAKREWSLKNTFDQNGNASGRGRKVIFRTWSNKFHWWALFIVVVGAAFQTAIYSAIVLTYSTAKKAGLNIGIAQAIWAIHPILVSILEKCCYSIDFNMKQVYGMSLIVIMAVLVSLSQVFSPKEAEAGTDVKAVEYETPIWVALLASLSMPLVCTFMAIPLKHVNETLKITPYDFTVYYWGIASFVYLIVGTADWGSHHGSNFSWSLFFDGALGSFFNLLGCVFAISCFSVEGCAMGVASAVLNSQTILVVILSSLMTKTMPSSM